MMAAVPPRLLVLAPDPSGERLAAPLVAAWLEATGGAVTALGGEALAAAGAEIRWEQGPFATLGFADALANLPRTLPSWRAVLAALPGHDALLVADARFLLERAAQRARAAGLKVAWLAPSPDWRARGPSPRTRRLAALADLLLVTDPLAMEAYGAGPGAVWVGNHLLQAAAQAAAAAGEGHLAGVFPGSRPREVRRLLPTLVAGALGVGTPGGVAVSDPFGLVGDLPEGVERHRGPARELLARCRAAVVAGGTVLQEAVVARVPAVMAYKVSRPLAAWIKVAGRAPPFWAHPNLLAGSAVVPELLQDKATPAAVASALRGVWSGAGRTAALAAQERLCPLYLAPGQDGAAALARLVPAR